MFQPQLDDFSDVANWAFRRSVRRGTERRQFLIERRQIVAAASVFMKAFRAVDDALIDAGERFLKRRLIAGEELAQMRDLGVDRQLGQWTNALFDLRLHVAQHLQNPVVQALVRGERRCKIFQW